MSLEPPAEAQTLAAFLKERGQKALRYLLKEAEAVPLEAALQDRLAGWPDQPWGIGQDGSIAGIVYHVAAWKQLTLPLFQPDGKAGDRDAFDPSQFPSRDDWPGILAKLKQIGTEWNTALADLPETEFDGVRDWDGQSIVLSKFVFEMIQHDIQHTAQIEYLCQRHRAVKL